MDDQLLQIEFGSSQQALLQSLKEIKYELIGNDKKAYYDKGLIEEIVPLLAARNSHSESPQILYECLAILNSFLMDMPEATDVFCVHRAQIQQVMERLLSAQYAVHVLDQGE